MILDFPGGVTPPERTRCGKTDIQRTELASAACIRVLEGAGFSVCFPAGGIAARGELLGHIGETPVYSPLCGEFRGVPQISGAAYFTVVAAGSLPDAPGSAPEEKGITEMDGAYIAARARELGIIDSRSGRPLHELLEAKKSYKRVVVDCTESDPASAINYRICLEKADALINGTKLLIRATGALRGVIAAEHYRTRALRSAAALITDEKLIALGAVAEKYPVPDESLMYALYGRELARGESAADAGVLIVGAECAAALYEAMLTGRPQTERLISVCGEGVVHERNLRVPRGATLHDVLAACGGMKRGAFAIENSLLRGRVINDVVSDSCRAVICAFPHKKPVSECVGCGECVSACPMRLVPRYAAYGIKKSLLSEYCIGCGACEYICPSGIPLVSLIKRGVKPAAEETK